MSDIFLRSDAALDAAISECTDPERIRELTKAHLAATGISSRERGNDWGARVIGSQPSESAPAVALPANVLQDACVRTIYPSGNNRFEIYGASEQELDEKERQIRSMFSGSAR